MMPKTTKPKRGRPPTGTNPPRQLGRVSPEHWQELQQAAERSGKTFTSWATEILLRESRLPLDCREWNRLKAEDERRVVSG